MTRDETDGPPLVADAYRTPRWVKVTGIVVAVVLLILLVVLAFGGPEHGPGRHAFSTAWLVVGLSGAGDNLGHGSHGAPPIFQQRAADTTHGRTS